MFWFILLSEKDEVISEPKTNVGHCSLDYRFTTSKSVKQTTDFYQFSHFLQMVAQMPGDWTCTVIYALVCQKV